MKYICLGYIEPGKFEGMTGDQRNAVFDECIEHNDHLRANSPSCRRTSSSASGDRADPVLEKRQSRDHRWPPMRKPRNSSAAFPSLKHETSIMPFAQISQTPQSSP